MSNESFKIKNKRSGCKYRTFLKDYKISNKGTKEEEVFIGGHAKNHYQNEYLEWSHLKNLRYYLRTWMPSSHSIFNYSNFLVFLTDNKVLRSRELLILDEAHLLETEIVGFTGISISKRKWKQYIPDLKIVDHGYDDIEKWIDFLRDLEKRMLTGNGFNAEMLSEFGRDQRDKKTSVD